jgi:hypothetical protein
VISAAITGVVRSVLAPPSGKQDRAPGRVHRPKQRPGTGGAKPEAEHGDPSVDLGSAGTAPPWRPKLRIADLPKLDYRFSISAKSQNSKITK